MHVVGYAFVAFEKTVKACSGSFDQHVSSPLTVAVEAETCGSYILNVGVLSDLCILLILL